MVKNTRPQPASFIKMIKINFAVLTFVYLLLSILPQKLQAQKIDTGQLLNHVKILAADSLEGRRTCAPGAAKARNYILNHFKSVGLIPFFENYQQKFVVDERGVKCDSAVNLIGSIEGTATKNKSIVISAHYDHEGIQNGKIFNGADDNASGVAAMLEIGRYFAKNQPKHDLIFCAFDAEELGLLGSKSFVKILPDIKNSILLDINIDMIGVSLRNELYIAGAYHSPFLKRQVNPIVNSQDQLKVLWGHDTPELGSQDWTLASDHAAFHRAKIPFLYFGVEDHAHHNQSTDTFENLNHRFFVQAAQFILTTLIHLDAQLASNKNYQTK